MKSRTPTDLTDSSLTDPAVLQTKVKHLENDLRLTREEYEKTMAEYFEIYSNMEARIEERTLDLRRTNNQMAAEIRERKRAQAALKESEEKHRELYEESSKAEQIYRSLLHTAADAIVMYDLEERVRYVSPQFTKTFGWPLEELEGKSIPFVPEGESASARSQIQSIVETGAAIQSHETKRITKDGQLIEVNISCSRYDDHEGNPSGLLMVLRDMTEKRRLEAQFQHAQRLEAVGTLAGGVAHDFNNMLMAIQGNAYLALSATKGKEPAYPRLVEIEKLAQKGAKLTKQLLGYARRGNFDVRPIQINAVVEEASETFARTRKQIKIHKALEMRLHTIEADEGQLEQVLFNLYLNAADAMSDGGQLTITTKNCTAADLCGWGHDIRDGDYVLLAVGDTGSGMDEKTRERIFEPFFTTKEIGRGTGLGLASVYGIVKAHRGVIEVDTKPGQGTTFSIAFPASKKVQQATRACKVEPKRGHGTLLLVDDEKEVRDVAAEMLARLGYEVLTADSGKSAVELHQANADGIGMVIMDMIMPEMSACELFENITTVNPRAKILLASGYSADDQTKDLLDRGCKGFIQKPFHIAELAAKIDSILAPV